MRLPDELLVISGKQAGVISRSQALATGVTPQRLRTLVNANAWQRPLRGVFVTHNGPLDDVSRIWAAVLRCGAGAVASHETAAHLVHLIKEPPRAIHVTVPSSRRVAIDEPGILIHHCADDRLRVDPIRRPPMTPPLQTLLDLIARAQSPDQVVALVSAACQQRLASPGAVLAAASVRAKVRWRALLLEVCRDVKAGVESPLERRYLRFVERAHGLPAGVRQRLERVGRATYRHDVLYEEFGVVVELDGLAYHRDHRAAADARRDNALMAEGLIVLRYRWADVASDPCGAARQIAAVLRRRGWTGEPGRCSNCRRTPSAS